MHQQKLYKNGNSVAVTIPKEYLNDLNWRDGSPVVVTQQGEELIISRLNKQLAPNVNHKFIQMVDEFIETHHDVLTQLANKWLNIR